MDTRYVSCKTGGDMEVKITENTQNILVKVIDNWLALQPYITEVTELRDATIDAKNIAVAAKDDAVTAKDDAEAARDGFKETITKTESFTLQKSDVGRVILCTHNSVAIQVTVPENLTTKNLVFTFEQGGDEILEIVAGNNVTIDTVDGLKSFGKHSVIQLYRKSDNHYTVVGGII